MSNVIYKARVQKLLNAIAVGELSPTEIVERFSVLEIAEARSVCFQEGYSPAFLALQAISELAADKGRAWLYLPASRPMHLVDVEVSYIYDGEPTTDYAFLGKRDGEGEELWRLTGREDIVIEPYAWRPVGPAAPVRA